MKHLITISLLLFSAVLYAQTNKEVKPANSNPNVTITPAIRTTVTTQPASMPNSNTNPTTGTVISLKGKKAKPAVKSTPDSSPVVNKTAATPNNNPGKPARKRATKNKN
jgi:PBP1b-binding outer membrane lipoprotein LpoB